MIIWWSKTFCHIVRMRSKLSASSTLCLSFFRSRSRPKPKKWRNSTWSKKNSVRFRQTNETSTSQIRNLNQLNLAHYFRSRSLCSSIKISNNNQVLSQDINQADSRVSQRHLTYNLLKTLAAFLALKVKHWQIRPLPPALKTQRLLHPLLIWACRHIPPVKLVKALGYQKSKSLCLVRIN